MKSISQNSHTLHVGTCPLLPVDVSFIREDDRPPEHMRHHISQWIWCEAGQAQITGKLPPRPTQHPAEDVKRPYLRDRNTYQQMQTSNIQNVFLGEGIPVPM